MSRSVQDLAMMMLDHLGAYRGGEGTAILDHIDVWQRRGYRGSEIQDGLEWLWIEKLIMTDDPDSPPVYPRASVLFPSSEGDAVVEANRRLTLPQRSDLDFLVSRRGVAGKAKTWHRFYQSQSPT